MSARALAPLWLVTWLSGCPTPETPAATATVLDQTSPISAPAAAPSSPLTAMEQDHGPPWRGVVVERLPAGSYTYLRVDRDAEPRWVAVMGRGAMPGDRVVVESMGVQRDFHSRRLGRDFAELHFATVRNDG